MAYNPTTWGTGDTITASALNKIEQGIVGAESSGGYDAELYIYHSISTSDDFEITLVSGTFADIADKLDNDIPPNILVRVWDRLRDVRATTTMMPLYGYYPNDDTPSMLFHVYAPNINEGWSYYTFLRWTAEDEVFFD